MGIIDDADCKLVPGGEVVGERWGVSIGACPATGVLPSCPVVVGGGGFGVLPESAL